MQQQKWSLAAFKILQSAVSKNWKISAIRKVKEAQIAMNRE